jgi:hypothetical protein
MKMTYFFSLFLALGASASEVTREDAEFATFIQNGVRPCGYRVPGCSPAVAGELRNLKKTDPACYAHRACRVLETRKRAAEKNDRTAKILATRTCFYEKLRAQGAKVKRAQRQALAKSCAKQFSQSAGSARDYLFGSQSLYSKAEQRVQAALRPPVEQEREPASSRGASRADEVQPSLDQDNDSAVLGGGAT